nr:uncharacterized protein LOC106681065 [Halyomorpha halys]
MFDAFFLHLMRLATTELEMDIRAVVVCYLEEVKQTIVRNPLTTTFAKKFDKTLCQLTINDTTGTLLKNKKIILHFKANQKVEFSVLIFFNLDYTFLCTMIYTATTYIVILVQFS